MAHVAFDTLKLVNKLEAAGVPRTQAVAIAEAQNEAFIETASDNFITKQDIVDLKLEITNVRTGLEQHLAEVRTELKQEIAEVRTELKQEIAEVRTELKQEITKARTELKQDIIEVRNELKQDIMGVRNELKTEMKQESLCVRAEIKLMKWMIGFLLTGVASLMLKAFF